MAKLSQLLNDYKEKNSRPFISFEYFPPRTAEGKRKIIDRNDKFNFKNWKNEGIS